MSIWPDKQCVKGRGYFTKFRHVFNFPIFQSDKNTSCQWNTTCKIARCCRNISVVTPTKMNVMYRDVTYISVPLNHDDVIKWKHFPRNWPFVREIHRSPVNFPHKGQWRGALMFSLIYAWINDWVNNREAGDLRRQHVHYDVIVMSLWFQSRLVQRYTAITMQNIYKTRFHALQKHLLSAVMGLFNFNHAHLNWTPLWLNPLTWGASDYGLLLFHQTRIPSPSPNQY